MNSTESPAVIIIDPFDTNYATSVAERVKAAFVKHGIDYRWDAGGKRQSPRQGRNDPCLCGSGKKFKKCCGGK